MNSSTGFSIDQWLEFGVSGLKKAFDANTGLLCSFRPSLGWCRPYPETSGYVLPTMLHVNNRLFDPELSLIIETIRNRIGEAQCLDGGFTTCDNKETYVFDTLAILDGLDRSGGIPPNIDLLKALEYLENMLTPDGFWNCRRLSDGIAMNTPVEWNSGFTYINIRGLRILQKLGEQMGSDIALRALDWVKRELSRSEWVDNQSNLRLGSFRGCSSIYTHPVGYIIEGLLDAIECFPEESKWLWDTTVRIINGSILPYIKSDGFVPWENRFDGSVSEYAYVCGVAQYASVLAKMYWRNRNPEYFSASKNCLMYVQNVIQATAFQYPEASGLSFQYANKEYQFSEKYGVSQINIWTIKYFIDALLYLFPRFNWHKTSWWYEKNILDAYFSLNSKFPIRIMELGSSSGHLGVLFAQDGTDVILVDRDKISLERAKACYNQCGVVPKTIHMNFLEELPLGKYDIVYNMGVLQTYTYDLAFKIVKDMKTLIYPGGLVIAVIPDTLDTEFRKSPYAGEFFPYSLEEIFKDAGLINIQTYKGYPEQITESYPFLMVVGSTI